MTEYFCAWCNASPCECPVVDNRRVRTMSPAYAISNEARCYIMRSGEIVTLTPQIKHLIGVYLAGWHSRLKGHGCQDVPYTHHMHIEREVWLAGNVAAMRHVIHPNQIMPF